MTTTNRLAGRAVALHCGGAVAVKRDVLEILGIVAPGGDTVLPDPPPVDIEWTGWKKKPDADIRPPNRRAPRDAVPAGLRELLPPQPPAPKMGRPPAPITHGTIAGYRAHLRRPEKACEECLAAERNRQKDRRPKGPRVLAPHGTPAAYRRHRKAGEDACPPCQEAARIYFGQKKKERTATLKGLQPPAPAPDPVVTAPTLIEVSPPEAAMEVARVLEGWISDARLDRSSTVRKAGVAALAALVRFRVAVEELDRIQRNSAAHSRPEKESA